MVSEYEYAQNVLAAAVDDHAYYAAIYQADPKAHGHAYPASGNPAGCRVAAESIARRTMAAVLAASAIEAGNERGHREPEKYAVRPAEFQCALRLPPAQPVIQMPLWCKAVGGWTSRVADL